MTRTPMPPLFFPSLNIKTMVGDLLEAKRAEVRRRESEKGKEEEVVEGEEGG